MSEQVNEALARLDQHIVELRQALTDSDWQRVAELNGDVRRFVDPVMAALEQRQLPVSEVQQRLDALNAFVGEADEAARAARAEAKAELEQVGQNRKAANAYARVSSRNR